MLFKPALDFYQQSLRLCEEIGDKENGSNAVNNIALVNNAFGNFRQAIEFYEKSIFVVGEERTLVFVITKSDKAQPPQINPVPELHAYTLNLKPADLMKRIANFRQQLAARDLLFSIAAKELYQALLAPAAAIREDGLLEAWELMQLNLHTDLVVLSACETARGRIGHGEGMIGLSWALFVAGSPTTVASQWKVESASTTELMLSFYRHLQSASVRAPSANATKAETKAEALRQASLSLLRTERYSHPFYWAGFVIIGDGN